MDTPYRNPAVVESFQADLAPYDSKLCAACTTSFRTSWDTPVGYKEWFCLGKARWWRASCAEVRPHVHFKCERCGAQWITAPNTAATFVRQ